MAENSASPGSCRPSAAEREELRLPPGDAGDLVPVGITKTTPFGGPDGHSARDQILLTVASSNTNVIDIASLNCAGRMKASAKCQVNT
jgi:hypothetical protein